MNINRENLILMDANEAGDESQDAEEFDCHWWQTRPFSNRNFFKSTSYKRPVKPLLSTSPISRFEKPRTGSGTVNLYTGHCTPGHKTKLLFGRWAVCNRKASLTFCLKISFVDYLHRAHTCQPFFLTDLFWLVPEHSFSFVPTSAVARSAVAIQWSLLAPLTHSLSGNSNRIRVRLASRCVHRLLRAQNNRNSSFWSFIWCTTC